LYFLYQPIIIEDGYTDNKIIFESLARVKDDKGNVIYPMLFLHYIEGTSLQFEFTKRVVLNILEIAKKKPDCYFSLNIDNELLFNNKIIKLFEKFQKENPNMCGHIVVELLESENIKSYEDTGIVIYRLKNWGYLVAIDDFGSGYSNYSHALELNVDFIKVDGEIIKQINTKKSSLSVVETLYDLSQKIKTPLIAEYIADEDIMKKVQEIGIQDLQGYYISEPIRRDQIKKFKYKWENKLFDMQKEEIINLNNFS